MIFVSTRAKFGISIIVGQNVTLIDAKMCTLMCYIWHIWHHGDTNAKISTSYDQMDHMQLLPVDWTRK